MSQIALFVRLQAVAGKQRALSELLVVELGKANKEATAPIWSALRMSPVMFGVFCIFMRDDEGRPLLNSGVTETLLEHAGQYLAVPPSAELVDTQCAMTRTCLS